MSWIKTLRLENFQSHLDTYIDFHKALNVIIGQSDSGKTSILRGIRWALFNQPRGSDFIRVGADFVRVTVTFSHGVTIVRERTSSKNRYILKEEGKEDLILEGFGTYAPKEILDAHQMKPLRIERDHEMLLHLAQQLEGPFLLDQSPATRAKAIGRISGAHFLDMAIRDTTKDVQKLKQQISYTEVERDQIKEKLEPFSFLDEAKKKLATATRDILHLRELRQRKVKLSQLKQDYNHVTNQMDSLNKQLETVREADKWEANLLKLEKKYDRTTFYKGRREERERLDKNIQTCIVWVEKTKHAEQASRHLSVLSKNIDLVQQMKKLKSYLDEINVSKEKATTLLNNTYFATKENEEKIKKIDQNLQRLVILNNKNTDLTNVQNQISKIENIKISLAKAEKAELNFTGLETLIDTHVTLLDKKKTLFELVNQIKKGSEFLLKNKEEEANFIMLYEKKLLEKGSCPTCGNDIDKGKLEKFLNL